MNSYLKLFLFTLFLTIGGHVHAATGTNPDDGKNNDTTVGAKSNIVIFKLITTPPQSGNNNSGSLKKAGKVARTSHSSIESILYRKKGI